MAAPSVTYTFSNSTAADATQVNQNFDDIINGITDGTKDLTINALTANGAASFNGNVTLGNSTGDDITLTGRIASDLDPKTAASQTIGDATQTWQALYLDNTTTDGGAIYFDGGSTEFLKANAAATDLQMGGFSYFDLQAGASIKTFGRYLESKSADYTVTDADGVSVILMTTSTTDRTVTLPTASANTGRVLTIRKEDSASGKITIDGEGAETIDGATTYDLTYQYASVTIQCTGSAWVTLSGRKSFITKAETNTYTSNQTDLLQLTAVPRGFYRVTVGANWFRHTSNASCYAKPRLNDSDITVGGALWKVGFEETSLVTDERSSGTFSSVYIIEFTSTTNTFDIDLIIGNASCRLDQPWYMLEKLENYVEIGSEWN